MSKCPRCGKYKDNKQEILDHIEEIHHDDIPDGYSSARYYYMLNHDGRDHGLCRVCKKPTSWDEKAGKPKQLCGNPKCKEIMRAEAVKNMMKRYGKIHLLNEPDQQKKMLANRKISGVYDWSDGVHKFTYTGSYEDHAIKFIDNVLDLDPDTIQMPGPAIPYDYHGTEKFWITDIYLEDFNLIIEVKDGGNNPNTHSGFAYNREIESIKDNLMKNQSQFNYIKLTDKNMMPLIEMLAKIRAKQIGGDSEEKASPLVVINESVNSLYYSKITKMYLVMYYPKNLPFTIEGCAISFDMYLNDMYTKYNTIVAHTNKDDVIFKNRGAIILACRKDDYDFGKIKNLLKGGQVSVSDENIIPDSFHLVRELLREAGCNISDRPNITPLDFLTSDNFISIKNIPDLSKYDYLEEQEQYLTESAELIVEETLPVLHESFTDWFRKDVLVDIGSGIIKNISSSFSKVEVVNGIIEIRGIKFNKLMENLKELYEERGLYKIFDFKYRLIDEIMFQKKEIGKKKMKVDHLMAHEFFALELFRIFEDLYVKYNYSPYGVISNEIFEKTWLSKEAKTERVDIDLSPLSNISLTLNNYQTEFIKEYPNLKNATGLRGYVLSFEQGLGKTLTSISLAECLKKEVVYIVCPNSLKENWAYEIKKYFSKYENENIWKDEVYIVDNNNYRYTPKTKYIICNQESISKIHKYIKNGDNMIIVDESHNFRNLGKRSNELIELREAVGCDDVLLMSGTPIKSTPNEIIPSMMLIDPLFTEDVAKIYNKCFNVEGTLTSNIIKDRFSRIIYRKTKNEVLSLPEKYIHPMRLKIKDSEKYEMRAVKQLIIDKFNEIYKERLKENDKLAKEFKEIIKKYSTAPGKMTDEYLDHIISTTNTDKEVYLHELTQKEYDELINKYVVPNITDKNELERLKWLITNYKNMKSSSMGKSIGSILPKYREEMFIKLYEENKKQLLDMIRNNNRKTVIFSSVLGVVNHIYADLVNNEIGTVKIVGGSKNRMDDIVKFKEDDEIDVLIATSQTLATGVTLTEANQMFFFSTPWRSSDFDQCSDRVHRIGQTNTVNIYNVLLDTGKALNISTRMEDILNWSKEMFGSMIEDLATDEILNESAVDEDMEVILEDYNRFTGMNVCEPLNESSNNGLEKIPLSREERAEINDRFGTQQCSFVKTSKGFYVHTHRCRTPYYKTIKEIPKSRVEFVSSTS